MEIEQITVFVLSWFAVGFLVALVVSKTIREVNQIDEEVFTKAKRRSV